MKSATLQTIADALGVSRMTVSRALRNDPSIPERTRQRVRDEAARQGYRPDPLVSALMSRLRKTRVMKDNPIIAYVDSISPDSKMRRFEYRRLMQAGAERRALELGYRFSYFNLVEMNVTEERIGRILFSRGIRGLVIAPLIESGSFNMDFGPFASASIGPSLIEPELHRAQSSSVRNFNLALEEITKLGCKRIGLVLDLNQDKRTEHVYSALMLHYQSFIEASDRVPQLLVESVEAKDYLDWVDQYRPDAVVGFRHGICQWVINREYAGHRPLVINLNWLQGDEFDLGIDQNLDLVGAAAIDLVIEQMQTNQYGVPTHPKTVLVYGKWVMNSKFKMIF